MISTRFVTGAEPLQRFFRGGEADGFGLRNLRDDLGEHRQVGLHVVDDEDFIRGGAGDW